MADEAAELIRRLNPIVTCYQTNHYDNLASLTAGTTYGAKRADGKGEIPFHFEVAIVGAEIIVKCSTGKNHTRQVEFARYDATNPKVDAACLEKVRHYVATGVQELLKQN